MDDLPKALRDVGTYLVARNGRETPYSLICHQAADELELADTGLKLVATANRCGSLIYEHERAQRLDELANLRALNADLCERIAAASRALSQAAEKQGSQAREIQQLRADNDALQAVGPVVIEDRTYKGRPVYLCLCCGFEANVLAEVEHYSGCRVRTRRKEAPPCSP